MYRRATLLLLLVILPAPAGWSAAAAEETLLTIDGDPLTAADFLAWWEHTREEGMEPPATPQPFIDWNLLYREAEKMGLYDDPGFMKKVSTFHKARTLMLLKNEEVDAKIRISDEEIRRYYEENYAPIWVLRILHFADEKKAAAAVGKLRSSQTTDEQFGRIIPEEGGTTSQNTVRQRPNTTHAGWLEIIRPMEPGEYAGPIPLKEEYVLLHLLERIEADGTEIERYRDDIRHRLWKQKQAEYTVALLEKLKMKYQVQIDYDRVARIDLNDLAGPFGDTPVVTTSIGDISEQDLVAMLRKEAQFRKGAGFAEDSGFDLKQYVLNGIISQTLTSHEALERRYEEKPPYDGIYEYYFRHRLIRTLEEKVFEPEVQISPEEVAAYYARHTDEFTTPETVTLGIIEGSEKELKALWADIVGSGDDFMTMASVKAPPGTRPVVEMAVDKLEPEITAVVQDMSSGDVSRVIPVKDKFVLIQLLQRTKPVTAPEAKAAPMIADSLRARQLEKVRDKYLGRLRAAYDIQVNEAAWRKLREKMSGNDESR